MAPRRSEIQVFFTAFVFFFLETALFHLLQFTHDHLESTLVISYALLGLAAGALAACLVRNGLNFPLLVLCFALSIVLAFINIVRFPGLNTPRRTTQSFTRQRVWLNQSSSTAAARAGTSISSRGPCLTSSLMA